MARSKIISTIKNLFRSEATATTPQPKASTYPFGSSPYATTRTIYFDGEKTPYELGPPIDYELDYYRLRARSWQAFIDSDIVQNAIKKYCLWIVGTGLKLQAQPQENILSDLVNEETLKTFVDEAESRFRLYADERFSTYNDMQSVNTAAAEALLNAINAGDVLCILRFDGTKPTMELVDGTHVRNPMDEKIRKQVLNRGNKLIQGVEINAKGKHVAYHVSDGKGGSTRVLARERNTGRLRAWLFYGLKHKLSDVRGMSLLTAVLETSAKIDRYKDATLGSAEEMAKLVYTVEHDKESTGEDININQVAQSFGKGKGVAPETDSYTSCEVGGVATKIAQSTSKQVVNMPVGASLKRPDFGTDLYFKDFFGVNVDIIYATIGIPPEVALDRFSGSYSSSRAALKSWEYKMTVDRVNLLKNQYYKPLYNFWLDINVLNSTLQAPGYLEALQNKNLMVLAAYRKARFIGVTVPHIDPLKEVNAERAKLGKQFDNQPLTTMEQAAENLNTGDADQIIKKAENEKKNSTFFDTVGVPDADGEGTS